MAEELAVLGYLVKPVRDSELAAVIEMAVARFEEWGVGEGGEKPPGGFGGALGGGAGQAPPHEPLRADREGDLHEDPLPKQTAEGSCGRWRRRSYGK